MAGTWFGLPAGFGLSPPASGFRSPGSRLEVRGSRLPRYGIAMPAPASLDVVDAERALTLAGGDVSRIADQMQKSREDILRLVLREAKAVAPHLVEALRIQGWPVEEEGRRAVVRDAIEEAILAQNILVELMPTQDVMDGVWAGGLRQVAMERPNTSTFWTKTFRDGIRGLLPALQEDERWRFNGLAWFYWTLDRAGREEPPLRWSIASGGAARDPLGRIAAKVDPKVHMEGDGESAEPTPAGAPIPSGRVVPLFPPALPPVIVPVIPRVPPLRPRLPPPSRAMDVERRSSGDGSFAIVAVLAAVAGAAAARRWRRRRR